MEEPPISNDEFLDSLESIGTWLRALAAYDSLQRFVSSDSTAIQRLASLSNIYLQLGAQLEDQAVSLIAFSVWSQNRDLVLADLFSRIFVRRQGKTTSESEVQLVHEKLKSGDSRTVQVDQRAFFHEVSEMSDAQIVPFFLGYSWRSQPSVNLIPKQHINVWRNLPGELRRMAGSFHEKKQVPRVTGAYNKLKHGPQLVVQNPIDRARKFAKSSNVAEQLARYKSFDKPSVRLLFAGARTQAESVDEDVEPIAPFLIDDESATKKLFFGTMVYQACFFNTLVKMQIALYRKQRIDLYNHDAGVKEVVEAQGRYLAMTIDASLLPSKGL